VDYDGPSENAFLSDQLDHRICDQAESVALVIGLNVSKVTDMAFSIGGGTVWLAKWVEMWACRGAAVGIVTKLVDVETAQGVGVVAGDIPGNDRWVGVGSLLESDGALDVGVTAEDSDCFNHFGCFSVYASLRWLWFFARDAEAKTVGYSG